MEIIVEPTALPGVVIVTPTVIRDPRGFFTESFNRREFEKHGLSCDFVQDNHSRSAHGVVRGMHFQIGAGTSKLVRCGRGAIWDVVVDIRKGSPSYGQWEGAELTDENHHMLYVPIGFAHGFVVESDVADVVYKCSAYYDPSTERGIAYSDPEIAIEWPDVELIRAERDANAPLLSEVEGELPFVYEG